MRTYNHVHWYIRWISMYLWIMPTLWYVICELSICTFTWSFIVLNVSVPPSLGQYSNTGLHVRVSGLHRCTGNICLLLSSSRPSQNPSQVCMEREREREIERHWLIIYCFMSGLKIYHLYGDANIPCEGLANLAHGLWAGRDLHHATPVMIWYLGFAVSSKGLLNLVTF